MKLVKILVLSLISASLVHAQETQSELETYKASNYIEEYVPSNTQPVQINGNKRITLAYYSALSMSDFGSIGDYEFQFGYDIGNYWLEVLIGQGKAQFGAVGSNSSAAAQPESEGNFVREDEVEESYLYMGVGASLRSRHLADLLSFNRVYETFHGYVTYHTLTEELREEDYAGFGARADASINYLLSESSHVGVKFSFGLSSLKRTAAYEGETSSQRSLMFHWNRVGLDYSFYF